jgi:hypothetical protein
METGGFENQWAQDLRDHIPQLSYLSKFITYHRPLADGMAYPLNARECREWVAWVSRFSFADFLFLFGARRLGDRIACPGRSGKP